MIPGPAMKDLQQQLKQTDFITLADFTKEELMYFVQYGLTLKKESQQGIPHPVLQGQTLAMIFEKPSTRTRVSFEVGMYQLGGHALFLTRDELQLGNGESVGDTAQTLSRYVDGIMVRTFEHSNVTTLAEYGSIPVINGLSDDDHPCQVLSDLMTIYEMKGTFDDVKLVFVGDGNNMSHALLLGCAIMGIDCTITGPKGYEPFPSFYDQAQKLAETSGAVISHTNDPVEAVKDADIIYTDVWTSMGWEEEAEKRNAAFQPYQVNEAFMDHAPKDALFFHCLPAKRGVEVTNEVIDGPQSVVFDQAENRLHIQKAILATLMRK